MFASNGRKTPTANARASPASQFEALRRETSVFTDAYAELSDIDTRIDGRMMAGTLVTGNFFQVLGVSAALGRALTPADDGRLARPSGDGAQLSRMGPAFCARPGYSRPPPARHRRPVRNRRRHARGISRTRGGRAGYWAPLSLLGQFRPIHAGKEDPSASTSSAGCDLGSRDRAALARLDRMGLRTGSRPARAARRTSRSRRVAAPFRSRSKRSPLFSPLFFAFGLILLIGCANVANLLLARACRAPTRDRRPAVARCVAPRIVRQLLTESLLLALMAAAAGFVISRVVLQVVISTVMASLPPDLGNFQLGVPAADWRVALFLVARRNRRDSVLRVDAGAAGDAGRTGEDDQGRGHGGLATGSRARLSYRSASERIGVVADLPRRCSYAAPWRHPPSIPACARRTR